MKRIFTNHIKNSTESEKRHAYGHAELMLEYLIQRFDKHDYFVGVYDIVTELKRVKSDYKDMVHDEIGVIFNSRDLVSGVLDGSKSGETGASKNKRRGDMDQVY